MTKNHAAKSEFWWWIVAVFFALILVGIGCAIARDDTTSSNETRTTTAPTGEMTEINNEQLTAILDDGTSAVVYIGRPTCPHCQAFRPILDQAVASQNAKILYYNTDAARAENAETLGALMKRVGVTNVPTVVHIANGAVVDTLETYDDQATVDAFLTKYRQ